MPNSFRVGGRGCAAGAVAHPKFRRGVPCVSADAVTGGSRGGTHQNPGRGHHVFRPPQKAPKILFSKVNLGPS